MEHKSWYFAHKNGSVNMWTVKVTIHLFSKAKWTTELGSWTPTLDTWVMFMMLGCSEGWDCVAEGRSNFILQK